MSYWRAYVDIAINRLLTDDHYRDATPEEIVDLIVGMAPQSIEFPAFERRKLVAEVTKLGGQLPEDDWWTPRRRDQREAYYKGVRRLRRNGQASLLAVSKQPGVPHRDTLAVWIGLGKLERPEDVSDR